MTFWQDMQARLHAPIDIAPLAYARIVLPFLMSLELSGGMFTSYGQTLIEGNFHFSYQLFPFVKPWPHPGMMYAHFIINFILGLLVSLGFYYRVTVRLFFLTATSLFLMEKTLYINHIYLYCLFLFLLGFLPAHRACSYDVYRKPELAVSEVPAWTVYILLFQISVVYFFAGLAKINPDWLRAQPMQIWLAARADRMLLGFLYGQTWYAYLVAYGGVLFDLLVVPLMLWKPTRRYTFLLSIFFHVSNVLSFGIGTFPWFSIAATALFFPPETFRKWSWLHRRLLAPGSKRYQYGAMGRYVYWLMSLFIFLQITQPLRPYVYPGYASWTEEGHFFAWRMMLRQKAGVLQFMVKDGGTQQEEIVNLHDHLNGRQINKMSGVPDMALQFAHYLRQYYQKEKGFKQAEVRVRGEIKLNDRGPKAIIHPEVDLGQESRGWHRYAWIMPPPPIP